MANKAITYRPGPRWHVAAAFLGALGLHFGVVLAAFRESDKIPMASGPEFPEVTYEVPINDQTADPDPELSPPPLPPEESDFPEATPARRPALHKPASRLPRPLPPSPGVVSFRTARTSAMSAPRPEYPYECRRAGITGSGVALVTVEASGRVTGAEMIQSTGNANLDRSAISAFSRWRFRPNEFSQVRVPITFTLMGTEY